MKFLPLVLAALCLAPCALSAQSPASPKYEMRGVWVATVVNLDWPVRGASPSSQQQALRTMFDKLQQTGINTIFFQIRSESDAMYASTLEPWSYYLTGQQGLPPSPSWDPLAFAIEEAHKRGMELHAWINPFRVIRSVTSTYPKAQNHLSVQHPDWMLTVKTVMLLNPGIPEARQYLVNLLTDVVKSYDIDGLHYDDYFYPYEGVTTEDQATYAVYGTGMTLNAWREDNINRFVKELSEAALGIKPWLKYGISPFGIWRSGNPPGITGLSGADVTYGNAVKWLQEKWIDYLSPQLYWPFGGNQDFAKLSLWWKTQMNGRHLYPGLALYRADPSMTSAASLFTPSEIPKQIRFLRENGIPGALHFRAANISVSTTQGVPDSLRTDLYRHRAFTPVMEWKDIHAPAPPQQVELLTESGNRRLRWSQPAPQGQQASPRFFCVYRLQASAPPDWSEAVNNPQNLLTLTDKFEYVDQTPSSSTPYWYAVSTLSRNSVESAPVAPDAVTSVKDIARTRFHITQIYPNPFESEVRIRFSLDESSHLTLRIVNLQGQEVARLANSAPFSPGEHEVVWNAPTGNKRQVYVCVLEGGGKTAAKKMIRL